MEAVTLQEDLQLAHIRMLILVIDNRKIITSTNIKEIELEEDIRRAKQTLEVLDKGTLASSKILYHLSILVILSFWCLFFIYFL